MAARTGVEPSRTALVALTSDPCIVQKHAGKSIAAVRNCPEKSAASVTALLRPSRSKPPAPPASSGRTRSSKPLVVKAGNVPVRIYRSESRGYETFTVAYYSGGTRRRESFASVVNARERANEIARAIINDRLAVLELTSADREGYLGAINMLRPFGVPAQRDRGVRCGAFTFEWRSAPGGRSRARRPTSQHHRQASPRDRRRNG